MRGNVEKTMVLLTFSKGMIFSRGTLDWPGRGDGRGTGRETLPGLRGRKVLRIGGPASIRPEAMLASADIYSTYGYIYIYMYIHIYIYTAGVL